MKVKEAKENNTTDDEVKNNIKEVRDQIEKMNDTIVENDIEIKKVSEKKLKKKRRSK